VSERNILLISGFARAGKDTLADAIAEWCATKTRKLKFADALKVAANAFLDELMLPGDFNDEAFKSDKRQFLVSFGRLARSINIDVFAEKLCDRVLDPESDHSWPIHETEPPVTVIVSDWRYINEWRVAEEMLGCAGWNVRTIYVSTDGIVAANTEEAGSILELRSRLAFDIEATFKMGDKMAFREAGRMIAQRWNL
jgi:hypothetical protein